MIIREATRTDLDAIVALLADDALGAGREAPGDPVYAAAFARIQAQAGNLYLVAEDRGAVVGCLQLTIIHGLSRRAATRAQIESVRVARSARGSGLGRRLIEAALERARDEGARWRSLPPIGLDLTRISSMNNWLYRLAHRLQTRSVIDAAAGRR